MTEVGEATMVWYCEKGHVDDYHIDAAPFGAEERCSRCGGRVRHLSLAAIARALEPKAKDWFPPSQDNTAASDIPTEAGRGGRL